MSTEVIWTPPDGGWGWVIVMVSLLLHALSLGVTITLSVMYVSWLETFEDGRGVTSWVISICMAVTFGAGPIPAALAKRYGFRFVSFVGGLLTGGGYILSYFATSVAFLVVTIGLISGMGCCFEYLTAVAVVSEYFSKRRSVAMGIGTAGVGIGSLIAAPILNWLIDTYGWRGALLLTGAATLNMCVCALLIRPLEKTVLCSDEVVVLDPNGNPVNGGTEKDQFNEINESEKNYSEEDRLQIETGKDEKYYSSSTINSAYVGVSQSVNERNGHLHGDEYEKKRPGIAADSMSNVNRRNLMEDIIVRPFMSLKDLRGSKRSIDRIVPAHLLHINVKNSMDALFIGRIKQNDRISLLEDIPNDESLSTEVEEIDTNSLHSEDSGGCLSSYKKSLMESVRRNIELLKDPIFLQFAISNVVTNLSYITPMMYLVDRAIDFGLNKDIGAMLIALTGGGGICGRLFFGTITYRVFPDRLMTYIVVLVLGGGFTMLSPLCGDSTILHCIYAALIGCFIGGYSTLAAVVVADIMGLSKAMESFGLLMSFMGVATLVGPPFAGQLFDWTRTYLFSYILFGFFLLFSGLMLLPTAFKRRRKRVRRTESESESESNQEKNVVET